MFRKQATTLYMAFCAYLFHHSFHILKNVGYCRNTSKNTLILVFVYIYLNRVCTYYILSECVTTQATSFLYLVSQHDLPITESNILIHGVLLIFISSKSLHYLQQHADYLCFVCIYLSTVSTWQTTTLSYLLFSVYCIM